MASMAETLTEKRGGVPTYVWLLGGVGVLVVIMFLRAKSQSKAAAAAAQSANNPALQTNVLTPQAAASLAQGAAPMGFSGGNVYNNVATSATGGPTPPPKPSPPDKFTGYPGFFYKPGSSQVYATISDSKGNTYSFDPLQVNGVNVTWDQFTQQAGPVATAQGYRIVPGIGDFTLGKAALGSNWNALLQQGAGWFNSHSVDANGNVVNAPPPTPVSVTSSWYGNAPQGNPPVFNQQ